MQLRPGVELANHCLDHRAEVAEEGGFVVTALDHCIHTPSIGRCNQCQFFKIRLAVTTTTTQFQCRPCCREIQFQPRRRG